MLFQACLSALYEKSGIVRASDVIPCILFAERLPLYSPNTDSMMSDEMLWDSSSDPRSLAGNLQSSRIFRHQVVCVAYL